MKLLDIISEEVVIKGTNVWNHIVNITPDDEMVPHGFEKLIANRDFKLVKDFDVSQLLKTDISFKEYYDSGEDRYEDDDDFDPSGIDEPIVVVDGELLDGYSRATASLRYDNGKKDAYVAIERSKGEDTLKENLTQTKIVDEEGEPLIVYRSQEDDRKQGIDRQSNTKGIYFSANPESTKIYGNITKEYYLNIKNPIVLKDKEWNLSVMPGYLYDMLVKKGYDGAVWLREGEMYEIIAFYPHQIIPINNKD